MSVFELHSRVIADYRDFVRSFITIADERAREFVDQSLDHEARSSVQYKTPNFGA